MFTLTPHGCHGFGHFCPQTYVSSMFSLLRNCGQNRPLTKSVTSGAARACQNRHRRVLPVSQHGFEVWNAQIMWASEYDIWCFWVIQMSIGHGAWLKDFDLFSTNMLNSAAWETQCKLQSIKLLFLFAFSIQPTYTITCQLVHFTMQNGLNE